MPTLLKNLKISTIGSVDRPANQNALAVLFKRADAPDEATLKEKLFGFVKGLFGPGDGAGEAKDFNAILAEEETDELLFDLTRALRESLDSILINNTVTDKQTAIAQSLQQFFTALIGSGVVKAGKKIAAGRLDMLKQMQTMLTKLIAEAEAAPGDTGLNKNRGDGQVPISDELRKNLAPEVQQYLVEVEKKAGQVDDLTAKVTDLEKKLNPDGGQEDIWKGVNPEIRKRLEDAEKRAKDAEELAKAEKDRREHQEFAKRAEQYPHIGKADDVAEILKQAYGVSEEYGKKLEETFRASNEQVAKGALFSEFGRSGGTGNSGNAVAKAETLATEMVQKNSGMTKEQALAKVWAEHPELYAEYEQEQNAYRRDS